jgi:hypothetical protein
MNTTLINELKSKCIVREQRGTTAFDNYMVDKFDTEKFAGLMVAECIAVLTASASAYDARAHFLVSEMIDHANLVLTEHFKVKE